MFPISKPKLSLLKISDYWSREINASRHELLAGLEGAWWLGEIVGDSALPRLELLKKMFKSIPESDDRRIVFVAGEDPGPPECIKQPDRGMVVDARPSVCVPSSDIDTWTEASCAIAFEVLAELSCFEHYPHIGPGLDYIELTRDEFFRWLEMRGFEFPQFWKRAIDKAAPLKQVSTPGVEQPSLVTRKRGRKPEKFDQVKAQMKADMDEGRLPRDRLEAMLEEEMQTKYGVSRDTARKARRAVLSIVEDSIDDKLSSIDK